MNQHKIGISKKIEHQLKTLNLVLVYHQQIILQMDQTTI